DMTRLMVAAELVGVMRRAFDMTVDYMKVRKQFGKPIATFQALKHRAVHAWVEIEVARAALNDAISIAQSGGDLARQASRAKARCSQAALSVTRLTLPVEKPKNGVSGVTPRPVRASATPATASTTGAPRWRTTTCKPVSAPVPTSSSRTPWTFS
ncbi:MAG: acyl-CoA/acyl-ACP dehydrogenase, partial [Streptomyces sp.]|nr:acyl-CoA/acyl-ACP dehydrogenase [Streptomyces sp.]